MGKINYQSGTTLSLAPRYRLDDFAKIYDPKIVFMSEETSPQI
jgi:hypothetical protein